MVEFMFHKHTSTRSRRVYKTERYSSTGSALNVNK